MKRKYRQNMRAKMCSVVVVYLPDLGPPGVVAALHMVRGVISSHHAPSCWVCYRLRLYVSPGWGRLRWELRRRPCRPLVNHAPVDPWVEYVSPIRQHHYPHTSPSPLGSSSAPRARLSTFASSAAAFDLPALKGSCTVCPELHVSLRRVSVGQRAALRGARPSCRAESRCGQC